MTTFVPRLSMIRVLTFSLLIHSAVIRPAGPAPTMRTSTLEVLAGDSPIFDERKDLEINEPIMLIFVRVLLVGRMNKTCGVVTPIYQHDLESGVACGPVSVIGCLSHSND